jgi:hypothetical protein
VRLFYAVRFVVQICSMVIASKGCDAALSDTAVSRDRDPHHAGHGPKPTAPVFWTDEEAMRCRATPGCIACARYCAMDGVVVNVGCDHHGRLAHAVHP